MGITVKQALENALSWWESYKLIADVAGDRGVKLGVNYEPTWIEQAQKALAQSDDKTE